MSSMDSQHVGFDLAIWAVAVALGGGLLYLVFLN
jgi:hypothetical protein